MKCIRRYTKLSKYKVLNNYKKIMVTTSLILLLLCHYLLILYIMNFILVGLYGLVTIYIPWNISLYLSYGYKINIYIHGEYLNTFYLVIFF